MMQLLSSYPQHWLVGSSYDHPNTLFLPIAANHTEISIHQPKHVLAYYFRHTTDNADQTANHANMINVGRWNYLVLQYLYPLQP